MDARRLAELDRNPDKAAGGEVAVALVFTAIFLGLFALPAICGLLRILGTAR